MAHFVRVLGPGGGLEILGAEWFENLATCEISRRRMFQLVRGYDPDAGSLMIGHGRPETPVVQRAIAPTAWVRHAGRLHREKIPSVS